MVANSTYEIFIGVVSGVLTAVVLVSLGQLWTKSLLPLIKEWKYQGIDISGTWTGSAGGAEITLELQQSTLDLRGLTHIRYRAPANSFDLSFHITGQLWEGYSTLFLKPVSRTVTSVATALLKVAAGGVSLEGEMAFRNINTDKVETMQILLLRQAGPRALTSGAPVPVPTPPPHRNDPHLPSTKIEAEPMNR
jgi:hypothetical protein